MTRALLHLAACFACLVAPRATAADDVTIYRCVDARQQVSMSSTPCPAGQQQETRTMLRPTDAPRRAAPAPVAAPTPAPGPTAVQVVVVNTPRALYECVRPDGSTYESDTGDGEPRLVPLWTLGYPGVPAGVAGSRGLGASPGAGVSASPSTQVSAPSVAGVGPRPPVRVALPARPDRPGRPHGPSAGGHGYGYGYGYGNAGTWVRDECHVLPQSETCARLDDRRDALRTRFFNAQQRERDVLRLEERGLNARLANDCGIR
nr:DUF4124 domain-containing protein [Luteimonas sp.]